MASRTRIATILPFKVSAHDMDYLLWVDRESNLDRSARMGIASENTLREAHLDFKAITGRRFLTT